MRTIIRYILITALRDWLFIGLMAIVFMAYGLSVFMGSTALVEQTQMSLAYFAGSSRIVLMTGLIIFICFHVRRSFENREIESILSKPISRAQFIVSYWVGFIVLAIIAIIPLILILAFLNTPDLIGLAYWSISLICEYALILAFALLAALVMRSAVSAVLSCFAFYLISRLMGFFIAALQSKTSLMGHGTLGDWMGSILKIISTIIPRLDLYAKSDWLIYGIADKTDLWIFPIQSAVYISLILAMAVFDLKRKEF